jgi:hypothetical protein
MLRKLWVRILVWLGLAHPQFKFVALDGTERSMDGIHCRSCQNSFWVENLAQEFPHCCPYCGQKFEKVVVVSNDAFNLECDSSN